MKFLAFGYRVKGHFVSAFVDQEPKQAALFLKKGSRAVKLNLSWF